MQGSEVILRIAVVALHWMCRIRSFSELLPVPLGTIVISTTTPGAITARNKLGQMFVSTATCPLHGPNIVAIKHVLKGIHSEKPIVVGTVVTMKIVIGILEVQEGHVSLGSFPANGRASNWIVQPIVHVATLGY